MAEGATALALSMALVALAATVDAMPRAPEPRAVSATGVAAPIDSSHRHARDTAWADRAVPVAGAGTVARLRAELGADRFRLLLAINRVDATWAARADTLWVPGSGADFEARAPWPERIAAADTLPRLLVVSPRVQAFAAYEGGVRVRWGPACTGAAATPTPSGWFHANWKARRHVSTVDPTWIMPWCVNFENRIGMALHEYALPGRPASHCCVRLSSDDARWVHDWVETWTLDEDGRTVRRRGTPLLVVGVYDFDAPPPWRTPERARTVGRVTAAEIETAWIEGVTPPPPTAGGSPH